MPKETIIIRDEGLRKLALLTIGALDLEKPWVLTIERETKRRTLSQNALMFMWIDEVVRHVHEHTGHDKDEIHEFFKAKFLSCTWVQIGSETHFYRSTKNHTTAQMTDYMNKIYAWATTELGLFLPVPEDLGRDKAA